MFNLALKNDSNLVKGQLIGENIRFTSNVIIGKEIYQAVLKGSIIIAIRLKIIIKKCEATRVLNHILKKKSFMLAP